MPQHIVDSWYCLDRVVPEGISQVSRRSEVGNTSQHPAIFWHFCGNFRSVRGSLQKLSCQSRNEIRTLTCFWYHLKKRVGKLIINGALSTPGYLLALLRELSHVPRGLTENAEAKQVRRTNRTDILYQIGNMVRKSIITV